MKKILVIGLGKVGTLVAELLSHRFEVTGLDKTTPHYTLDYGFDILTGDVTSDHLLTTLLPNFDAVVSALPYYLNQKIAEKALGHNIHYFDLTEDLKSSQHLRQMANDAQATVIPQCGLAPGFIAILGGHLANGFDRLRDIELRVGALPRYPNGQLAYSFTWSPAGVINEYLNDAEVIHNGERKKVPSLDGIEQINIEGRELEAFSTSGGLGTMCETFAGRVDTLNYKTIRYPGHGKLMRFLIYELIMKEDKHQLEKILSLAKPPVKEDVVYVYVVVEGWKDKQLLRDEYYKAFYPRVINGKQWRAISWTTAASIAAVVSMVADGLLPQQGCVKQEDINYNDFLNTDYGKYLA